MAKIKAAFGSFSPDGGSVTYAAGPHDDTYEQTGVTSGDLTQHTKVVNVINWSVLSTLAISEYASV